MLRVSKSAVEALIDEVEEYPTAKRDLTDLLYQRSAMYNMVSRDVKIDLKLDGYIVGGWMDLGPKATMEIIKYIRFGGESDVSDTCDFIAQTVNSIYASLLDAGEI